VIEPVLDLQDLAACNPERPQAGRQMENLLEQGFRDFSGIVDETILQQPFYRTHQKALSRKAPIALKIAMELIDDSARLSLQDGLDLELSRLAEVFSSQDARLGLLSILDGSKAEFSGE